MEKQSKERKIPATFSLRFKIILTFFIISSFVSIFLFISAYSILQRKMFRELQKRSINLTQIGSLLLDKERLKHLLTLMSPDLSEEEIYRIEKSEDYRIISNQLNQIREIESGLIQYVYIFTPTEDENQSLYVVDADVLDLYEIRESGQSVEEDEFSHFNSTFDISDFPVARKVIKERVTLAEEEYFYDEVFKVYSVSGYSPIFDSDQETLLAVIGLDMVDTDVKKVLRETATLSLIITAIALSLSFLISIILGIFFTRGIIYLDKIVRHFGEKNLDVRAEIHSKDEVGRLGLSFNRMAETIQHYSIQLESLLKAYSRFVPQDFLHFLKKESITEVQLGDQVQREMTIMFSDIRAFTELSESMNPRENFNFLNSYLSRVGPEIRAHNGFIDKYVGDAIMALFPIKPDDAVRAAIAMHNRLKEYNMHRKKSGYAPVSIGIGIHTGNLMLGTVGEHERMDGSVIADAVNLCARLESLTRLYGGSILISGRLLEMLENPEEYLYRFVDRVRVKGRKEIVLIYEVFDGDPPDQKEKKLKSKPDFDTALQYYYARDFTRSGEIFRSLYQMNPEDKVYDLYLHRCERFIGYGVPPGWQGIEEFHQK